MIKHQGYEGVPCLSSTSVYEYSRACERVHQCSGPALWSVQPLQLFPVWVTFFGRALEQSSCLLQLLFQPSPPLSDNTCNNSDIPPFITHPSITNID